MITIYSSSPCHYCDEAKKYFKENNLEYTEYNVKENLERRAEMTDLTGSRSVPVIMVGTKYIIGWNKQDFINLMNE